MRQIYQYDINDFFTAVSAGNFPAVSYPGLRATKTHTPATPIRSMTRRLWLYVIRDSVEDGLHLPSNKYEDSRWC